MGRIRKYQISVGLSSDLIDMIEEKTKTEGISRSRFIERIIRENIDERCNQCSIEEKLRKYNVDTRHIEFPISMEEADELIEEEVNRPRTMRRHRERSILEIVRRIFIETAAIVNLADVLTEAERLDIGQDTAEDIIEALCADGRLMRPGGYDTLQPV